jgi:predicted metal-dependent enzyme (double-stranded beta helix superfamily)
MTIAAERTTVRERRDAEVAKAVADVRAIERDMGVNRAALEKIKQRLLQLAADRSLFPTEHFPLAADESSVIYRLSEDPDQRFAMYMSTTRTGRETPPHNHTTWACIVGVRGKEHNKLYDRIDDGATPFKGEVRERERYTVEHGKGIAFMPEDIHSIHLEGEAPMLMIHMYGLALDRLEKRIAFNREDGTYRHFGGGNIKDVP